jgi:hypothetical protein
MKKAINMIKGNVFPFIMLLISVGVVSCSKKNNPTPTPTTSNITYSGNFVKSADSVVTSASGTTTAILNPTTREFSYILTWTGLTTNAVGMHFHDNGPIIIPISNPPATMSGTVSGKVTLTPEQVVDLDAGKIYSQIHTQTYPGGEIKATMSKSGTTNNQPGTGPGY